MMPWLRLAGIAAISFVLALVAAWFAASVILHESETEVRVLMTSLSISGALALVIGFLVIVVGMPLLPRLVLQIGAGHFVVSLAAILTLVYGPVTMFMQPRDLRLLIVLLVYFLVIAIGLATIVSLKITSPLHALATAARSIGAGALHTHVELVASRDEVFEVTMAFNRMANELVQAGTREQTLQEGRRHLIAAISHDLRTPLAGVRLTLEGIRDGLIRDDASIIRGLNEIDHLGRLIEDLFELSQLEEGRVRLERELVNMQELVAASVDQLRPLADERKVTLAVSFSDGQPDIVSDPVQVQRVITNLVQNGIQHTASGGEVRVSAHQSDSDFIMQVVDTGTGITPSDLPYIFDYFYRADEAREQKPDGAGLGLSIAKAIVESHGGTLRVEGRSGQGARFTVTLPVSQPPPEDTHPVSSPSL